MSLRDDLTRVAHDWLPGDLDANTAISLAEGFADAAHDAVRSHVNRLADELEAEVTALRQILPVDHRPWTSRLYAMTDLIGRHPARVRALCEEQTEARTNAPVDCSWCDGSGWRDDMGVHCNHSIHREAKP